ncbi:methyltransferase family protein [Flavobacteriaceae bacterium MAR_2010_105]|nr:methyltransferase family protein [Flavobacteriaceae bacterium MAR_2010_105]
MRLNHLITHPKRYWSKAVKRLQRYFRRFVYRGGRVNCLICGWNGLQFFNETCPKCNARSRTRLMAYALKAYDVIQPNLAILHVAPNKNEYHYVSANFVNPLRYDRFDIKQRQHTTLQGDITDTQLDSAVYDLVIIWHVLEHVPEDKAAISELYRVLKQGGQALVSVPIYPAYNPITQEDPSLSRADYQEQYGHYDHCRSCGLDYYQRFEALGFKTQTLAVDTLNSNTIIRFGLRKDHVVWCFTK